MIENGKVNSLGKKVTERKRHENMDLPPGYSII